MHVFDGVDLFAELEVDRRRHYLFLENFPRFLRLAADSDLTVANRLPLSRRPRLRRIDRRTWRRKLRRHLVEERDVVLTRHVGVELETLHPQCGEAPAPVPI